MCFAFEGKKRPLQLCLASLTTKKHMFFFGRPTALVKCVVIG